MIPSPTHIVLVLDDVLSMHILAMPQLASCIRIADRIFEPVDERHNENGFNGFYGWLLRPDSRVVIGCYVGYFLASCHDAVALVRRPYIHPLEEKEPVFNYVVIFGPDGGHGHIFSEITDAFQGLYLFRDSMGTLAIVLSLDDLPQAYREQVLSRADSLPAETMPRESSVPHT